MRMIMTPTEILEGFLNSEGFDDLVTMRLKLSLESSLETLRRLQEVKDFTPYQFDDYVDTLQYARALVVVLGWFSVDEWADTVVELNKLSIRLDNEF